MANKKKQPRKAAKKTKPKKTARKKAVPRKKPYKKNPSRNIDLNSQAEVNIIADADDTLGCCIISVGGNTVRRPNMTRERCERLVDRTPGAVFIDWVEGPCPPAP